RALQRVRLDAVALQLLQDVAGALEDGGHGSFVGLQQVLTLRIAQLRLQQAQLCRSIRAGAGRLAQVGDLGRERIDRLSLLSADRAVELIRHLGGGGGARLIALRLALEANRLLRNHILTRDVAGTQIQAVRQEVLGDHQRGRQGQDQGDGGGAEVGRPATPADVTETQIARENAPPSPESPDRQRAALSHLFTGAPSRTGEVGLRGASPPFTRRRDLLLALHAGLFVVLTPAHLGEDAVLLDLLIEASKGALEGLVVADLDLRHLACTPSDRSPYWADV